MTADREPRITVRVEIDGGFAAVPGLSGPFDVDTDTMDPGRAAALRALLDKASFFTQPAESGAPAPGAADMRTYTITASQNGRTNTVRALEPIADPGLADLVAHVTGRT